MAIPVKFQQFKSAGIYRIVYDKSTVLGTEAELLRLVVGYSPKGPFNTPVYIKSVSEFKTIFGDVSKSLEKRGCYFHRTCIHALTSGPILCLNLKKFSDGTGVGSKENVMQLTTDSEQPFHIITRSVPSLYDTTRFWTLEPENLNDINGTTKVDGDTASYLNIAAIDSIETSNSVFIRKAANSKVKEYNISVSDWYKSYGEPIPDYLVGYENALISDFFTEVYVFNGKFTVDQINASKSLQKYFSNTVYKADDVYYVYGTEVKDDKDDKVLTNYSNITMYTATQAVSGSVYIGSVSIKSIDGDNFNTETNAYTGPIFKPTELQPIQWVKEVVATGENTENTDSITYYRNSEVKFSSTLGKFVLENDENIVVTPSMATDDTGIIYYEAQIYTATGAQNGDSGYSQPTYYSTKSVMYGDDDTVNITEDAKYPIWVSVGDPIYGVVNADKSITKEGTPIVLETVMNAFGDELDALDALYNDSASGALAHYIGTILPNFIDNNSGYKSIDILFNVDSDIHHMMMSLDDNLLDTEDALAEYIVEINPVNNEKNFITPVLKNDIANRTPYFLRGYVYENAKPLSNSITDKLNWQTDILNVLSTEKGLRTALLSPAEIEYRYIVDSFETYWKYNTELKNQLSLLAMEKELCFAICNFPAISTYAKQGETFTTNKVISVQKIVNNTVLPSEPNGASFCAFYTPLKFSDGYVDTIVPSAGLVSNLFIDKYNGRAAYSIIAGPNYGAIRYNQLVGPDYHYSQDELHIIEPFGVNCMVYRPTFGTFINANQTAKQTPKSALSSINVRELVIYLQDEIGKILQSYQWEFNNPTTREAIKAKADIICETAKRDGGIQKYLNVMDESNNDADIIDNEMCVLSTSIEPGRGAGKMIHELTIYRTGGMSSMITEE